MCGVSTINSDKNKMKKIILLVSVFCVLYLLQAQNSVPNGGFENWTSVTSSHPTNYDFNSNKDEMGVFNVNKTTGYSGSFGVELKTVSADGIRMAYMLNENPQSEDPSTWHGGIPFSQIPTGIQGYYKYNQASGDQGMVIVVFSKNGTNIGVYSANLGGLHTEYTPFNFTFSPALTQTPDSVIIAFASSGFSGAVEGSTLVIDNISFTGVASQPALMYGDFEQWTDVTIENPVNWKSQNTGGIFKTTDAHKGGYALELKTYLGEEDNVPRARPAQIMTAGYYPKDCNGNCYPIGGFPFTNQSDVLEFYYKYAPTGNIQANVGLYFKKKNSGMDGWYGGTNLSASSHYTFVEIPINLGFVPDSVIIQINSSNWENSALSFVGSDLKIDEMRFRSQNTSLYNVFNKEINISPNPTEKGFFIEKELNIENISITDVKGAKVLNQENINNYVNVSNLQRGVYIVMLQSKDGTYKGKLIKK